ncbi:MAG: hypothetical protein ABIG71_01495 [Candidatus Uhrbacteria bacterium]
MVTFHLYKDDVSMHTPHCSITAAYMAKAGDMEETIEKVRQVHEHEDADRVIVHHVAIIPDGME